MEDFDFAMPRDPSDTCIPIFHTQPILDDDATEAQGKQIYKDTPFVEIIVPGNDKERVIRPVEDQDKARWPDQWRRYQEGGGKPTTEEVDGTPIDQWPQITPAQAKTLQADHINTVEQLAQLADIDVQSLGMGMMELRNRAEVYVKHKAGETSVQKAAANTRAANKKIKTLEKRLKEMQTRLEELEKVK